MHCLHRNEIAGVAQLVAHLIGSEEVTGSIPVASLIENPVFLLSLEGTAGFLLFLVIVQWGGIVSWMTDATKGHEITFVNAATLWRTNH